MAMPHAGIVTAASDPANSILQPDELNGLGIYSIRASVPVAYVNFICAMGMPSQSLEPLVYGLWDGAELPVDVEIWPEQLDKISYSYPYLGGTPFDDIFQWGPGWGEQKWPPIFPKLPVDYNTMVNDTTNIAYGRNAIYILGKGGAVDANAIPTVDNYALCELRVGQTPNCSTQYNASSNVGTLEAICEDPEDDMRYVKSLSNATCGNASVSPDWPNIASMWAKALNLNSGLQDSNGSNSRLWSELILTDTSVDWQGRPQLSDALPSPAEALAVMAGCTLLQSTQDAPFVEFWNYSSSILDPGQTQWFNASIREQQYASGGSQPYQKFFYIVLLAVFLINVIVLLYFCIHREWYNDFSDPTNLFSLAINSPPSEKLAECSCGVGSKGEQFKYYWKLGSEGGHVYMESPEVNSSDDSPGLRRRTFNERIEMVTSPVIKAAGRWRKT